MLPNASWTVLEPLVETGGPHPKVRSSNTRRTIRAVLSRQENCIQWRSRLANVGRCWMAAQAFACWARLGVGTPSCPRAGARYRARHGIPGGHQRASAPGGWRCHPMGTLKRNGTYVKGLAGLVAALGPRLA